MISGLDITKARAEETTDDHHYLDEASLLGEVGLELANLLIAQLCSSIR